MLATLWFIPTLLVVSGAGLAVVLVQISPQIDPAVLEKFPRVFGASPESARGMLVAIAGSMITVAGVTFSITIVAVTQASAQFSPRILRNFMRDRPSQIVLGGLTGVFTYCLVVLRTIRGTEALSFVPSVAVLVGFVLAGVGIALLIWFIHHIAEALQASSIITRVADDTLAAIDKLFPAQVGDPAGQRAHPDAPGTAAWRPLRARRSGYIQWIEGDRMIEIARDAHAVLRMERGVGDFVVEGTVLTSIAPMGIHASADTKSDDELADAIDTAHKIGSFRTVEQDAAFGVRQLTDIALRALSPGINDPTTAINCIDYLGVVLSRAAARDPEPLWRADAGVLRVIGRSTTFEQMVDEGLGDIRRYSDGHLFVLERLIDAARIVGGAAQNTPRRECLVRELGALLEHSPPTIRRDVERARLIDRARRALAELA
ncbi:MAG: DUF2254 domain-containing protein [Gemmatimonadaceae bacterium]